MKKRDLLLEIKDDVINLHQSPLYTERVNSGSFPVIGEGNHDAQIMFIGEAPGAQEAKTGKPFCGSAGKILTEMLEEININREDVYITNILKDRPPHNRDPLPQEIEIYTPFLNRQINIIQPKVIVSLGRFSAQYIMNKFGLSKHIKPISTLHGNYFSTSTDYGTIKILILMHPAIVIYNRSKQKTLQEGFMILKNILQ